MRRIALLLSALALVTGLAACGDDDTAAADDPTVDDDSSSDGTSGSTPSDDPEGSDDPAGPVTIVDGTGTEVTLDQPAEKVVALEWAAAEDLMLLGIDPVGVAEADGYGDWVAEPALPDSAEGVGTRVEPSIERIQALAPDLIVGVDFRHAAVREQLEAIAPTLLFSPYGEEASSQLEGMRSALETLGEATGRVEEANAVLAELDDHLAEAASTLADAGFEGQEIAIAQGFTAQGSPTVRMFSDNAMVVELLDEIGLPNGWPGEPTEYGFDTVDLEGLTRLGDVELFTISQDDDDIFTGAFAGNPIWEGLPFVQRGAVHPLGGDTWTFGGPASAEVFVDRVVEALVA